MLSVKSLTIKAGKKTIVKDISFEIPPASFVALSGSVGSGKTSIAKSITQIHKMYNLRITSGQIIYKGRNLLTISEKEMMQIRKNEIRITLQNGLSALNPSVCIGKQIEEGNNISKDQVFLILKELKLSQKVYSLYPSQLSGGMQQRAMLATLLAASPKLIILDEISSKINYNIQNSIEKLLLKRKNNGSSILYITHTKPTICVDKHIVVGKINQYKDRKPYRLPKISDCKMVEAKNLYFKYDKNYVIKRISFSAYKGETLGIVGDSGCGKTTLCKLIAKILKPTIGSIDVRTEEVQIILQNSYTSVNPYFTVKQIIEEPAKIKGFKTDTNSLMEFVELDKGFLNKYPGQLSGGEQQKVCIARAISTKPKLIIFDEPFASMDGTTCYNIINKLKEQQSSTTYLIVSHNMQLIENICDKQISL